MPVIYMTVHPKSARLISYTVRDKPGQGDVPRVLHAAGVRCRPETSAREFARTRARHGTQGATRRSPSRYALPEEGETATHVKRTYPGGRRYWAPARVGEAATHVRHEGRQVPQAEARHVIVSFGLDEVNPDDPEQVASAFEFVVRMQRTLYPGIQAHLVGQADGDGRAFHVHIAWNATLHSDMTVDGKTYTAGRKLAGDLTNIDKVHERADRFLADHGAEYGLGPQRLPSVAERRKQTRNARDRNRGHDRTDKRRSNHDRIRDAFETAIDDPRAVTLEAWTAVMAEHGVTVTEPGWRRGKPPKIARLSYQLDGMATPVRASTLGTHYDHASTLAMLDDNAYGRPRPPRPAAVKTGPPRPVTEPTPEELTEAHAAVVTLAREEQLDAWIDDRAREDGYADGDGQLAERGFSRHNPDLRAHLHQQMAIWIQQQGKQASEPEQTTEATQPPAPAVEQRRSAFDRVVANTPSYEDLVAAANEAAAETIAQARRRPATPAPSPSAAPERAWASGVDEDAAGTLYVPHPASPAETDRVDEQAPVEHPTRRSPATQPTLDLAREHETAAQAAALSEAETDGENATGPAASPPTVPQLTDEPASAEQSRRPTQRGASPHEAPERAQRAAQRFPELQPEEDDDQASDSRQPGE
ncbi:hypothetical protein GCM10022219_20660 [Microbacterium oryzae]|uniref:Relaxase n=1 Tax=Microbacterium oryzae TaxID=743009 RepID=A0A6I6E161_9MICO|nr:hypothetical protein D7D94_08400 [Microbacterium oryzae]